MVISLLTDVAYAVLDPTDPLREGGGGRFVSLVRRPSLGFLAAPVLAAAAAPLLAPHDPTAMNKLATLTLPSWGEPLGTDQFGRDILSRLLHGARIALAIGVGSDAGGGAGGRAAGLWAGWQGGVVDGVAMRGVDTLLAIPPVLLAMGLVAMTGPGSLNAGIAVTVVGLPQFARLARAGTLGQKRMEYAEAAVALGATDRRILFRAHPAQHPLAHRRAGAGGGLARDPAGGEPVLPGTRHPAAGAVVGSHGQREPELHVRGAVVRDGAGRPDRPDRAGAERGVGPGAGEEA